MTAGQGLLPHGGDLDTARRTWPDAPGPWIDLSTGINPWPFPVGPLEPESWTRLPGAAALAALRHAAARRYGVPDAGRVAAAPGTQALIQLLPRLRPPARVAIQSPTYNEHAHCWAAAGHEVTAVPGIDALPDDTEVCVVVNPNNPDGRLHPPRRVLELAAALARRGGWLVVDEAFADTCPEASVAPAAGMPGLVVLRSFGKFYGLAGLRLGFVLADTALVAAVEAALGPWSVSGPALEIGRRALEDDAWTAATRLRLEAAAAALDADLAAAGLTVVGGTPLFRLVRTPAALALSGALAAAGLWVRRFPDRPDLLRFGLPPDDPARARLRQVVRDPVWRG
ncbi:threonine-phosphate decarboxylase CobD [Rhodospirillum centenum]|uniref:threonine-phosphate decarboxylase n=1 Tax=Rhodospirillum centenum (strain ATCC 51521 / SW) TaxID=414684 RepID=B6IY43_RHOCS|nr:threonine-phosphate decarboxylase CobD [Rhodospirillum centenum]ACJ01217.1 threonine-phosphate decarboxylase [Rhodospirillum centenum SW]